MNIYNDISTRTQGDIYIGVVGPVRTGKSTFIKKFMESLVIPNISGEFQKERARDELPQSAAGRTYARRAAAVGSRTHDNDNRAEIYSRGCN